MNTSRRTFLKQTGAASAGTIDFKQIFTYKAEAGYKTFFVEQEAFADEPPSQAIATSFKYIKNNLV